MRSMIGQRFACCVVAVLFLAAPSSAQEPGPSAAGVTPQAAAPEAPATPTVEVEPGTKLNVAPTKVEIEPASKLNVEACASDPSKLGLSRVVEIDTTGGPHFGGMHGGNNTFLQPGEVVLTFDDGPSRSHTRTILKALADHCTRATFFMVGRMAVADPEMVREVAAAGHTVASHTMTHKNLGVLGLARGRQEVELAISAITKAYGAPIAPFFRYPYLSESRVVDEYTRTRDIATFWIDVDSKDYMSRDPRAMQSRIMNQLASKGKGIILMHDIQLSTVRAIADLLDELHKKGYKVVHVVPKSGLPTIADFDDAAERMMTAKAARGAESALANRAVTWTTDADPTDNTEQPVRPRKRAQKPKPAPEDSQPEILPWSAISANEPPPAKKPQKKKPQDSGSSLFNF